ncbi:MAG: ChaB family protein [Trueperaceae bacterium]|nr:ChaB family protein [Trueperaceae bacterium]
MPYRKTQDLPEAVQDHLPKHAQEIYKEAYNSAFAEYKNAKDRRNDASREEVSHRVAWAAVKKQYHKNESSGDWEEND